MMEINGFVIEKKYIIAGAILLTLIIILAVLLIFMRNGQNSTAPSATISPSVSPTNRDGSAPNDIVVTPLPFTGAQDPEFTTEEADIIDQERALRRRIPYNGGTFIIQYNYNTDNFEVEFTTLRSIGQADFESWVASTYPAIKKERFIFVGQ